MSSKKIIGIGLAALVAVAVSAFVGCSDSEQPGGGEQTTYVMEAEYVDIANVIGSGLSNEAMGYDMIYGEGTEAQKEMGWSSGYYVGYTYTDQFKLDFVFTSDKAATATIIIRLGSELGDITLTPSSFSVALNGTAISYGSLYVSNSESMAEMQFSDKTLTTTASLVEGENTITVSVLSNNLKNGNSTGGPTIDCIKIQTDAVLTYTERTDNPSYRGAI